MGLAPEVGLKERGSGAVVQWPGAVVQEFGGPEEGWRSGG